MFLYVAYTAAHSPLQPLPRHAAACTHLPHTRRRDYCGMVVGLDEALRNLTATIEAQLGSNTIMVVASDNGGSAYFGGTVRTLASLLLLSFGRNECGCGVVKVYALRYS
jgi:arylsulfatase A-like enzyme